MVLTKGAAMTLTLLLADDHQIVRHGLRAILQTVPEFRLVGEAADGLETLRLAERLQPDVLVLDIMMSNVNGLEVARQVRRRSPRTRVVILSMYSDEAYVVEALRAGAAAYVLKDAGAEELVRAIHEAAADRRYLSSPLSEHALGEYMQKAQGTAPEPYHTLTSRERQVFQLTAEGQGRTEIAQRLFISPRTVESHRANVMRKLGVRNLKELIRYAVERGILPAK
jgi:two-component system response regulator NreC